MNFRIGHGFDSHNLIKRQEESKETPFLLGGIVIDENQKCEAHSDGDALLHALIDSFLGALALDDIGEWFANTNPNYKQIASKELLSTVLTKTSYKKDWSIINIDFTIVLEQPKLSLLKPKIKQKIATLLGISQNKIGLKAKTFEDQQRKPQVWVYCVSLLEII
jgi:2-C-methyl-D-erythritol 2,4-cyclodiphosphate synthase